MTKKSFIKYGLVFLLPILGIASCNHHDDALLSNFKTISADMSQQEVIKLLGRPTIEKAPNCQWEFVQDKTGCVELYVYASAWAPLIPEYPVIWFNGKKHVIDTYVYSSP